MWLRRIFSNLIAQLILAFVLGILCGLFFGEKTAVLKWVGDAYVRLLQMTAIPYVVVALIRSIGQLTPEWAGKIGLRGGGMMLLMWLTCLLTVLVIPLAFPDWPSASYFSPEDATQNVFFDPLALYIPSNIFESLADSVIPAVIVFCVSFGIALIWVEGKEQLLQTLQTVMDGLGRMASYVAKFTPIAFFAISAHAAGTLEVEEFNRLQVFLGTFFVAWLLLVFWTFPMLVALATPFSYKAVLRNVQLAMVTAFASGTVLVALPLIAESCKEMLEEAKLSAKETDATVDMMVPIMYALPKAGTFLGLGFVLFAAWFIGSPLSLGQYPSFAAVGGVSIFGGLTIAVPFMLDFYGLPADLFQLYLLSGAFTNNFEAALGAIHGLTLCLLVACAVIGHLRWHHLIQALGLAVVLTLAVFSVLYLVFSSLIPFEFQADKQFLARTFLNEPVVLELVTDPAPLPASAQDRDRLAIIRERGSLRVAYPHQNNLPLVFLNSSNELVGLDMELMHTLARDLGVGLELVQVDSDEVVESLASGRVDVTVGFGLTPDRASLVAFTQPYVTGILGFVVQDRERRHYTELSSVALIRGLKVAAPPVDYYVDVARKRLPNAQFTEIESPEQFFKGQLDHVDAMFYLAQLGAAWTFIYPRYAVVVPTGLDLRVPIGMAVAPEQVGWLNFLNSWLDLKISTGVIQRYVDYWVLGRRIQGQKTRRWSIIRNVLNWVD
jgi:Na+/H+-dicarboxylate symporter/ABC-type amino acid transport substrate-binding protein